jgi:hypothetical protein
MLHLTPRDVNTCRALANWALRLVSLVVVARGAFLVLKMVLAGLGFLNAEYTYKILFGSIEDQSFYRGLAMIGTGVALGLTSDRLVRWAMPVPPQTCPRCGYASGQGAIPARCPECGLQDVGGTGAAP